VDLSGDDFEVILATDLALPEFESFCFRYDISELSTAIKPYAISSFSKGISATAFLSTRMSPSTAR